MPEPRKWVNKRQAIGLALLVTTFLLLFTNNKEGSNFNRIPQAEHKVENISTDPEKRASKVRKYCQRENPLSYSSLQGDLGGFLPGSLTVSTKEELAWCRLGKVGTHAWSALFLLLKDLPPRQIKVAIHSLKTHSLLKENYRLRSQAKLDLIQRGIFTFIVVRHPFRRLVSAYRDKLQNTTQYNLRYKELGLKMVKAPSRSANPSFSEFVEHLLNTEARHMDKHWAPYFQVCQPCKLEYKAVLKLETIAEDAAWLFSRLNLTSHFTNWQDIVGITGNSAHVGPGGSGTHTSADLAKSYFEEIPKEKIRHLYSKYKLDFEIFDYSPSEFL